MRGRTGRGRLVRTLAADGQVAAIACITTGIVEEARRRHDLYPTATAALGRLLTAAALLASTLKGRERVMLQVVGDGPVRHLVAEADAEGSLRGYAGNPRAHLPPNASGKLDVSGIVGRGQLVVVRDLGMREPYRGTVPLVSGEIAQDVAYYLARSEQTPSAVALGVLVSPDGSVRAAGGWLIMPLPRAEEELLGSLERRVQQAPTVTEVLSRRLRASPRALLEPIFGRDGLTVLEERPLRFRCGCSRRRFEAGLVALGADELRRLAAEQPSVELACRFCGKVYRIPAEELRRLALRAGEPRVRPGAGERWSVS